MYCLIIYMLESDLFSKESNNGIPIHTRTHTHARTHSDARLLFVRHGHTNMNLTEGMILKPKSSNT